MVRVGTDLVVTNVDNSQYRGVDLICIISQDYLNIRKIILPSLQELHRVFNDIIAASKIFPQVLDTTRIQNVWN